VSIYYIKKFSGLARAPIQKDIMEGKDGRGRGKQREERRADEMGG
jgi:hypothetical protein